MYMQATHLTQHVVRPHIIKVFSEIPKRPSRPNVHQLFSVGNLDRHAVEVDDLLLGRGVVPRVAAEEGVEYHAGESDWLGRAEQGREAAQAGERVGRRGLVASSASASWFKLSAGPEGSGKAMVWVTVMTAGEGSCVRLI